MLLLCAQLLCLLGLAATEPFAYFKEQFLDRDVWTDHCIEPKHKLVLGKFVLSAPSSMVTWTKIKAADEPHCPLLRHIVNWI